MSDPSTQASTDATGGIFASAMGHYQQDENEGRQQT